MNSINLADVFVGLGRYHVNRPALISGQRHLTYSELVAYSSRLANALLARGVAPGDNVGIAVRDGFDLITYMLALWMADAVAVPLEFRSKTDERARLVADFDLVLVICDAVAPGTPFEAQDVLDGNWLENVARQSSLPPARTPTGHTAMISLTSGTTGKPLGMLFEHAEVLLRQYQQRQSGLSFPNGVFFNAAPTSFSASRTISISRMCEGTAVHFFPSMFSPEEFIEAARSAGATYSFLVPTALRSLIEYARIHGGPVLPFLDGLQSGGSMSTPEEKREAVRLLTPNYCEVYASSIAGTFSLLRGSEIESHADTVGRPISTVRLEIVDDQDRALPTGEAGIIRVRTPSMVSATYKDASRPTGDRIKDGWIYPGDLGSLDADGYLRILGRTSDVIIRGGANVHPSEIESVLSKHPAVRAVAVAPYSSEREGEEIGAVVVSDGTIGEADMLAFSRVQLSPDKRPRRFVFVQSLPATPVGKPDKAAIKKLVQDQ